jgi:serine protease AprX
MTPRDDSADRALATEDSEIWQDRVLCALDALASLNERRRTSLPPEQEQEIPTHVKAVKETVGARFASYFTPESRLYEGPHESSRPAWEQQVVVAVDALIRGELVAQNREKSLELTELGRAEAKAACQRAAQLMQHPIFSPAKGPSSPDEQPSPEEQPRVEDLLLASVLTESLRDELARTREKPDTSHPIMIALNLHYSGGLPGAGKRVADLWDMAGWPGAPMRASEQFMAGELTAAQIQAIVTADAAGGERPDRAILYIWLDFPMRSQIDVSCTTIKALPAQRSFGAFGEGIVWAVVDSGIDKNHPHFEGYNTLDDLLVRKLHRDFTGERNPADALKDENGHGTHVAGIIAGGLEFWKPNDPNRKVFAFEERFQQPRSVNETRLAGMAPRAKLVSLKVNGGNGNLEARTSRVIEALAYVRRMNGESGGVIHGVNLSLGYAFDSEWTACGQSPLCVAVDSLVRSGVVVVVASGNSGAVTLRAPYTPDIRHFSAGVTINDPGNAQLAITVGSTHRDSPHTNGISHFSSRGPTADGRPKPDLVAPGERVMSAAVGLKLDALKSAHREPLDKAAVYIEDSGTSMAAPHVSGAIAAFLSVQRELIGQPEEIKRIFMATATSLRRDSNFQGAGLVDLMRALQAQ